MEALSRFKGKSVAPKAREALLRTMFQSHLTKLFNIQCHTILFTNFYDGPISFNCGHISSVKLIKMGPVMIGLIFM